jgi:signal transduction histidine kinase/CheY-like chemotaxis protein
MPLILLASGEGEGRAVAALREGAADYLLRDRLARLGAAVARAVRQRRLERDRQARKLEALGRLAERVAHDFNNFLTVITGYSELALRELPPEHTLSTFLQEIHNAGERANARTRQLLEFGRMEAVAPVAVDLDELLRGTASTLRRLLGNTIQLTLDLTPGPSAVRAEPGQLEQALLELATNARAAMPAGGSLSVQTRAADLSEVDAALFPDLRPGPYVLVTVRDTGVGMDEATRARLFEPFFTTRGPDRQTGLGLALVYSTVKRCGGHVEVESAAGAGSTFHIYLPRAEGAAPVAKPPPKPPGAPGGTETVLLAEDEDAVRALARLTLASGGYTVLEARDGQEALDICQREQGPVHLLVTDILMPKISGRELADRLAVSRPGLKVLFLSGYPEDAVLRQGVTAGFLQKPFTPAVLAHKVREVLDQ